MLENRPNFRNVTQHNTVSPEVRTSDNWQRRAESFILKDLHPFIECTSNNTGGWWVMRFSSFKGNAKDTTYVPDAAGAVRSWEKEVVVLDFPLPEP